MIKNLFHNIETHPAQSVILGLIALAAIWAALSMGMQALKVTDPSDPRFNPDRFSFSDYKDHDELVIAFRKLFPIGTPKKFVDRVLVKAGRAKESGPHKPTDYFYSETSYTEPYRFVPPYIYPGTPVHLFYFDQQQNLVEINVALLGYVHGKIQIKPDDEDKR